MKGGIFLAIAFTLCFVFQYSVIYAFGGPFLSISLLSIGGILVFQRVGLEEGVVWFFLMAVLRGFDVYAIFWAVVGSLLLLRVFTTRSLYALLGLGLSGHILVSLLTFFFEKFVVRFFPSAPILFHPGEELFFQTFFLIPGLLVGVIGIRILERFFTNRLYFRRP